LNRLAIRPMRMKTGSEKTVDGSIIPMMRAAQIMPA